MCWTGDLSNELQSHSIDSRNYQSPKSEVVHEQNSFERSPIQHKTPWPKWLGVRLQRSNGCCWEIKSHWRQLFSKFFFPDFFCLADLLSAFLSEILIVKNPIVTFCLYKLANYSRWLRNVHLVENYVYHGKMKYLELTGKDSSIKDNVLDLYQVASNVTRTFDGGWRGCGEATRLSVLDE